MQNSIITFFSFNSLLKSFILRQIQVATEVLLSFSVFAIFAFFQVFPKLLRSGRRCYDRILHVL